MKYLLLVYTDEKAWTDSEREHCYVESTELTHELNAAGNTWARTRYCRWPPRLVSGCVMENRW